MTEKIKFVKFNTKRSFGIEFEVNRKVNRHRIAEVISSVDSRRSVDVIGWGSSINNGYWHVKTDSTCGDTGRRSDGGGYEVASFVGKGYKDLKVISKVVLALREEGLQVNRYCGLHVHAQVKDFNLPTICKLGAFWFKIENIMKEAVPERRRNGKYCKLLGAKMSSWHGRTYKENSGVFWEKIRPKSCGVTDKRKALNFTNYAQYVNSYSTRCTLELRLPEGTLNYIDVENWTRLYLHFISSARKLNAPQDFQPCNLEESLIILGLHGEDPFYLLSSGLFQTKLWFLNRILRFSHDSKIRSQADSMIKEMLDKEVSNDIIKRILGPNYALVYKGENEFVSSKQVVENKARILVQRVMKNKKEWKVQIKKL